MLKALSQNERAIHAAFLLVGLVILAYVIATISVPDILDAFSVLGAGAAVIAAIVVIGLAIRAVRLKLLVGKMADVPLGSMFMIVFETALFSAYSPGKTGELTKLDMLKRHGIRRAQSMSAIVVERAYDLAVVAALSAGVLATLGINMIAIAAACAVAAIVAAALYKSGAFGGVLATVVDSMRTFMDARTVLATLALTLVLWLVDTSALYFVLNVLGYSVQFDVLVPVYFASIIVGLLSLIPGGLGSMDFSFSYGLGAVAGVPAADAITAILAPRIVTFMVCLIGSVLYFVEIKAAMKDG